MTKFITVEQVIAIHDAAVDVFGGLAGIRDRRLIETAVEMAKAFDVWRPFA
jgi:prophage maintenance system killer protein